MDEKNIFLKNDIVTTFPNITEILFTKIDKKYLVILLINFCLRSAVLFFLLFWMNQMDFEDFSFQNYSFYLYGILGIVLTINFALIFIGFNNRKYAIREKDISYKKGVLLSELTTVPYNRIQHLNVTESLFERVFQLASLHVFTAGDDSSDLVIKGLPKKRAYEIREYILQKTKNL